MTGVAQMPKFNNKKLRWVASGWKLSPIYRIQSGSWMSIIAGAGESKAIDQRIQQLTQPILADWRRRGLINDVVFSGRTLPAHLALGILSLELVVHGWDFAVALDRPLQVSDAHAAHVLGLAQQTLTAQSRATAGFDPPVPVPDSAGALDRLIAFTGRDPKQMNPRGDSPGGYGKDWR
jgi:uncharacterized protein (TIGR03086 family)